MLGQCVCLPLQLSMGDSNIFACFVIVVIHLCYIPRKSDENNFFSLIVIVM